MPELPDVETFKRYLDATALHQSIGKVRVGAPRLLHGITPQGLGRRLHGRALESPRLLRDPSPATLALLAAAMAAIALGAWKLRSWLIHTSRRSG